MQAEIASPLPFETVETNEIRIGLICLASDATIEREFRAVLAAAPGGIGLLQARIANDPVISPETLAAMGPRITQTTATLLPGERFDAIAYGCTSATMVLGPDSVTAAISAAKPDTPVTTPATAAVAAMERLGIRRPAVLTPYAPEVNRVVRDFLIAAGLEIAAFASFEEPDDRIVARIAPESLAAAVRQLAGTGADGIFVSCTAIGMLDQIAALEAEIGLPILSSNQALAWDALRLAGREDGVPGLGRLFAPGRPSRAA
ncbi:MAG: aspartate/glutamate racemase family protein [Pseudomonadota bacterium]